MSDTSQSGQQQSLPRREFIRGAAMAAAGLTIVPRHVLGGQGQTPPSDMLNVAGVGIGGMGRSNMTALASQNIVALCDVDWDFAGAAYDNIPKQIETITQRMAQAPAGNQDARMSAQRQIDGLKLLYEKSGKAKRYVDYREMLEKQKDIDAVMVATPDHTHAVITLAAMSLGKHVYTQKPLAWSVEECRALAKKAKDNPKLVTQMGNQGHSSDGARLVNEYIAAAAIGDVKEVHVWTNRPLAYWPQGIPKPEPLDKPESELRWNLGDVMKRLADAMAGKYPVPDKLNWELFLGPAPYVEYHPVYHPFNWRGWTDWGVGAIGDMGAHLIDHPYWALDLDYPTSIETQSTPFERKPDGGPRTYPMATTTYYTFPAKGSRPALRMTWYDGGLLPPKPAELGEEELNKGGGVLYYGSKGILLHDNYGGNPRLLPKSLHDSTGTPPQKYERITTSHEMNWVNAIKGDGQPTCPFSYAAPLTETMLLGVAALNAGKRIDYDGANMRVTNVSDGDRLLKREYRSGWSLT